MHVASDAELVKESLAGKAEAFGKIVLRYQSLICSLAYSATGSLSESEDVAQETFLAAWKKLRTLREPARLRPWLCRIARNRIYHSRQRQRLQSTPVVEGPEVRASSVSLEPSPRELAINKEEEAILWRSIQNIPQNYREPLVLFYREGQSIQAVARSLELTEEAVKQRLCRGRRLLEREVLGFVEGALKRTRPGKKFTLGVLAALPLLRISSKAALLTGPALFSTVATPGNAILMTILQKTAIVTTLVLASVGIYEAHQASTLRTEVQGLREQLASIRQQNAPTEGSPSVAVEPLGAAAGKVAAPALSPTAEEWASRLLALNTNGWRAAAALGDALTAIRPDDGLAILRTNWAGITNVTAREQLITAFYQARHQWLPAVLDLGLHDKAPEVQNRTLQCLGGVALHDFSDNYSAGLDWLDSRSQQPLSAVLSDALSQTVQVLSGAEGDQIRAQLKSLGQEGWLLRDFPDVVAASGLEQPLAQLVGTNDAQTAELALNVAGKIPLSDDWRRTVALPLVASNNPWAIRDAAAAILGGPGRDWALSPLLNALSDCIYSSAGPGPIFGLAGPIGEIGSATSIPYMIGLIEADNSYNSIYGIGYFGLSKITGVPYDESHDGAWWLNWWNNNKQRFPADAQAVEIPQFAPVPKVDASSVSQPLYQDQIELSTLERARKAQLAAQNAAKALALSRP